MKHSKPTEYDYGPEMTDEQHVWRELKRIADALVKHADDSSDKIGELTKSFSEFRLQTSIDLATMKTENKTRARIHGYIMGTLASGVVWMFQFFLTRALKG